jgi:pentatricopeptide repeat protein
MQATYNSLFLGYVKNGRMEELLSELATMKERNIMPTNLSLQTTISGFLDYNRINDVLDCLPYLKVSDKPFPINLL